MDRSDNVSKPRKLKRSDNVIPDYDHLFEENSSLKKGKRKSRFFGRLIKMNAGPLVASSLIYILQAAPTWILPLVTANIINIVTETVGAGLPFTAHEWRYLGINAIVIVVALLQNVPTTVFRFKVASKMLRNTSAGIKCSVVRKLQSLSITYHKDMQTGKIQSKFLKDIDSVDNMLSLLTHSVLPNIISVIIATVISVYKNGFVALFFLLVIPCNVLISFAFRKKVHNSYRDFRIKTESMSTKLSTMLSMMTVTKSHGLEQTEISEFRKSVNNLTGSGLKVDNTNALFNSSAWVVNTLLSAACLVFCAVLAIYGHIGVGDIVLYQTMFTQISGYVSNLLNVYPSIGAGMEALNSVSEIMNATDVEINIGKATVSDIEGRVEFKNLSYKYPNTEQFVVKDLNLDVKAGECIAVVGASGSGKSTIMNLIIGFLKPTAGELFIDGKSIEEFDLSEYRHHISVVPQNSILFAGTIRENITYGLPHYTEEELMKAVEMANITEFLKDLPNGLDTDVGEHGGKLSGGQKQRITIARALIRNPRILILDEATSALDNISEYHVQKAIASSIKGRTTFIVAHRLSTIRDANRIIVMENGECVESGTFDELIAKKGKFYELKNLNDLTYKSAEENLA